MAERFRVLPWHMRRLTARELDAIEAQLGVPGNDGDVEIPEGAGRMLEPPVPEALRGL